MKTDQHYNTMADRVGQLFGAGRPQEAIDLCRNVCQAPDAKPEDWLLYGCVSADAGDNATATIALGKAVELDPDLAEAQFGLGKLLMAAGDFTNAIDRLLKAAELQPDNADIWLALGIAHGLAKQAAKAEEYCRRALELEPGSAGILFNLANALQAQGKLSEAEAGYEAALAIEPGLIAGWSMLAQISVGLGRLTEAEAAARRALALDPRNGEAHFTLGGILETRDDKSAARDHFRQAAELLSGLPVTHLRLARVLHQLGELPAGIESCQRVINIDPTLAEAHFLMGECLSFLKASQSEQEQLALKAEASYRQAVALNNDHLQAHYRLAFLYMRLNRTADAARHLREVLRINPNDEQARHLLTAQQGETPATAPAAYVSTLFDEFADTFDSKMVNALGYHGPQLLFDMFNQLAAPVPRSLDVIDLGCGTGLCAPLFRDMARRLHGVDLSARMIEKARERTLYDSLEVGDIVTAMKSKQAAWDLALSADVFIYIGALEEVFAASAAALKPGGYLAFSIEDGDDSRTFVLRSSGRYAHATTYIRSLAAASGFQEVGRRAAFLRIEKGRKMPGYLFLLRRPVAWSDSAYRVKYTFD